jgi:hypothetical protein
MAIKLSKYFGVPAAELRKRGVFNAHLGIDNRLFVDPNLLKIAETPEFRNARTDLDNYFAPVIKLLKASKTRGDVAWIAAWKRLTFDEEHGTALGYAHAGEFGRGIGPHLAEILVTRGKEIVDLGIDAAEMFELIGLFQEQFGSDLLSDMAVAILKERFIGYTQRVTTELKLQPQKKVPFKGKEYSLPVHPNGKTMLLFVPAEILSPLPVALDRSEIDEVADFNDEVRQQWNAILAAAAKTRCAVGKSEIREMLFSKPKNLADLIEVYRKSTAKKYDFEKDPDGILSWEYIGCAAAEGNPLAIDIQQPKTMDELRGVVGLIVAQFKKNIEDNKLYEVLYNEDGSPRRELFAQRLFFATADTYCEANDVDLSREPDAGSGPVDFKLSTGYNGRLLVEVKKSNNSDLLHGFETQLPAYETSEATHESIYLIIRVADGESAIRDVLALREKRLQEGRKVPDVVVIDARKRPSASKR